MLAGVRIDNMSALYRLRYKVPGFYSERPGRQVLRFLYASGVDRLSLLYARSAENLDTAVATASWSIRLMSILDGVSLAMAVGLFIYLLVALLRAGRS